MEHLAQRISIVTPQEHWYLTDGSQLVGPVDTDLLLRGITHKRVPEDCYIAQPRWHNWRTLDQVREVRALWARQRLPEPTDVVGRPDPSVHLLAGARNSDEAFRLALLAAVRATGASVGVVHRDLPPHFGLVTTHSYGVGMQNALGGIVPWYDEARGEALWGRATIGEPDQDVWARASASRLFLGQPIRGAALLPVCYGAGPRTLIELGRFDHGFRASDAGWLESLAQMIALRLDQLAF